MKDNAKVGMEYDMLGHSAVMSRGEVLSIYGSPLKANEDGHEHAVAALTALRRAGLPAQLIVRSHRRAVVVSKDGRDTWAPVAHLGKEGFRLLSHKEALESAKGRVDVAVPPGGWRSKATIPQAITNGASRVNEFMDMPSVKMGIQVGSAVLVATRLLKAFK
mgnify:CR=1 FL=1